MVPDFLILSSVPEAEASAPAGFSDAGALLSLQALRPSMSALAQNSEVMARLCIISKTPFIALSSIALIFDEFRPSIGAKDVLFYV